MSIRFTEISQVGDFGIVHSTPEPEPPPQTKYRAPDITEYKSFSVTVDLFSESSGGEGAPTLSPVISISAGPLPTGIFFSSTGNRFTVSGSYIQERFPGEFFRFVMFPDYSKRDLDLINDEDYLFLHKWNLPSSFVLKKEIPLWVVVETGQAPVQYLYEQYIGWEFDVKLAAVNRVVRHQ